MAIGYENAFFFSRFFFFLPHSRGKAKKYIIYTKFPAAAKHKIFELRLGKKYTSLYLVYFPVGIFLKAISLIQRTFLLN